MNFPQPNFPVLMATILLPSLAYASVDFTPTVIQNAQLLLFLISVLAIPLGVIGKVLWDRMNKNLEEQTQKANLKEDEAYRTELKLKEQEISQLKLKIDRIELEHNSCQRNLPMQYVTRQDYDKFVLQHREEFSNLMNRMEGMIKEFRNEIKTDMQGQIDRIVDLLGKIIEEK